MKNLLLVMAFVSATLLTYGQERKCAAHEHMLEMQEKYPDVRDRMNEIESFTQDYVANRYAQRRAGVITIPVVVHVVYNTAAQNISDAQIQSQIDVLNEDFRKLNADLNETEPEFIDRAADFEIEFCLATRDPNGNPTTGIQRKSSTRTSWGTADAIKFSSNGGFDAWPRDSYLNIWVGNIGGGILGYAQFPGGPAATDGIVVGPNYFGRVGNVSAPFNEGETTTHEVGHWLNLRHIWGDGPCGLDDFVADTPPSDAPNYGCPLQHNSCSSKDNVQNYMDYTDDACMTMFTEGQKARTLALFSPGGARAALLNSLGCGTPEPVCIGASGLQFDEDDNSIEISFTQGINAENYILEVNVDSSGWETAPDFSGSPYTLGNLSTCTWVGFRLTTDCGDLGSEQVTAWAKTTGPECKPPTCDPPETVTIEDLSGNILFGSVKISWDEVSNADNYRYQIRIVELPFISATRTSATNSVNFSNLPKFLQYEVRVQAFCPGLGWSSYSGWERFRPGSNRFAKEGPADVTETLDLSEAPILQVYPNPASKDAFIKFAVDMEDVTIKLVDITGRTVSSSISDLRAFEPVSLDLGNAAPGLYFVTLNAHGMDFYSEKIMISR